MVDESVADRARTPTSLGRRLGGWYYRRVMRLITLLHTTGLFVVRSLARRIRQPDTDEGYRILLTGSYESDSWLLSYLRPLAASPSCSHITVVSSSSVPSFPKVNGVYPPKWLTRVLGATPARLLMFVSTAIRERPNIVGGYHLLANGLVASLLAPMVGARSLYHCVGGPAEVLDGGLHSEGAPSAKMEIPDAVVERRLLRAVAACDLVLTMGTKAVNFFQSRGVHTHFHVVSACIDFDRFAPAHSPPCYDIIFVGRLAEIKCVDILLRAVKCIKGTLPDITAVIVGEGPLRSELEQLSHNIGVHSCVTFAGKQENISEWLNKARVFALTSRSEGLSIALTEAMACGLPAVVPDVGDLADLVENGVNGYLVKSRLPEAFAQQILGLLTNGERLAEFSVAARSAAARHRTEVIAREWDRILAGHNGDAVTSQT